MEDVHKATLQSQQKALDSNLKLYGEDHPSTADSYDSIGVTKHELKDYKSALWAKQTALNIRLKLYGEDHPLTADSYHNIGVTQYEMKDYKSALQSSQKALNIRLNLYGEDHRSTAESYHSIGLTQHEMKDYKSAVLSSRKALNIRLKLYGEDHSSTADSYHIIGVTQLEMGEYNSALRSKQKALNIRLKLYGEDHPSTADSYHSIGATQHMMEDHKSALRSEQKALNIRLKLYGEHHQSTAESYHSIGVTQHNMEDYNSALHSKQKALNIRLNLYGKDHPSTTDSYRSIGVTQLEMEDYEPQSKQKALNIRLMPYADDYPSTAASYGIGVTQHEMEGQNSVFQAGEEELNIRCTIDEDGGSISFPSAGAFFYFPANAVSRPTTITCTLVAQEDNPLELKKGEYFCSSIVAIESEEPAFAKPVTVLLSHSVAVQGPYLDYYDVTMMQGGQQWNDLVTKHCREFEDLPKNSGLRFPDIRDYLPVAMATVHGNCTAAVATRIRSENILVVPDKPCVFLKSYGEESTLKISFPVRAVEMECCLSVKVIHNVLFQCNVWLGL